MQAPNNKIGMKISCAACGKTLRVPDFSTVTETGQDKFSRIGVDYFGSMRSFLLTVVPGIIVACFVIYGAYLLSYRVMMGGAGHPPLGPIHGRVTLDGEPFVGATVIFNPILEKNSSEKLAASVGITDDNGRYILHYVKDVPGAAVGDHKVFITGPVNKKGRVLPKKYHGEETELNAVVTSEGREINFDLKTAPRRIIKVIN